TNVVVTENFLGTDAASVTAQSLSKKKLVARDIDPALLLGNKIGLRVDRGQNFSTAPLLAEIYGNLIAENKAHGAVFNDSLGPVLEWAYIYDNGGLDPCGGGIWLKGTIGFIGDHLYIGQCLPNGIEIDNSDATFSSGAIIRNSQLQMNSS